MSLFDEEVNETQSKVLASKKSDEEILSAYSENLKNTLWTEKYRPKNISEYLGDEDFKKRMSAMIESGDIKNLLLAGTPGLGKTSIAKMIVNSLNCDWMYINASDENGIEVIREKVTNFARSTGFNSLKIIILDEADAITREAQNSLKSVMEEFSAHTRFILTSNTIERINPALISRCQSEKVIPPSKPHIAKHLVKILTEEKIKFDIKDVAALINLNYPDIRKTIGAAQQFSKVGSELKLDKSKVVDISVPAKIVEILKSESSSKFNEIRQVVADSGNYQFDVYYKYLFDTVDSWAGSNVCQAVIILAEMQYKSGVVPDREINFMSCIAQLIETNK